MRYSDIAGIEPFKKCLSAIRNGEKGSLKLENLGLTDESLDALLNSFLPQLEKPEMVTEICLSGNRLTVLPEIICKLPEIDFIRADHNQLIGIPDDIGNLSKLEYLELGRNKLKTIPESTGTLKSLRELELHYNRLSSLPDSLSALSNLLTRQYLY
jgi:Leucine-rich repeat (LRR) protein